MNSLIFEAKRVMNEGGHFKALLNNLSKAFDYLLHDLVIAKLDVYGFNSYPLYWILSNWIFFQNIISGVAQDSLLAPLLQTFSSHLFFIFALLK